MKKILLSLVAILFTLGCGNKKVVKPKVKKVVSESGNYKIVSLKDNNITVFKGIIPSDWNVSIESNWNIVNSDYPGLETIHFSSPDHKATIKILSQHSYTENKKFKSGENKEYYTTYLNYMNADKYLDYFMNKFYSGSKLSKKLSVDENLIKLVSDYNNIIVSKQQEYAKVINAQGQMTVNYSAYSSTAAKKQYTYGNNYVEVSTAVAASKSSLRSKISDLLNSDSIAWIMPYTIIYSGEDKESFDKYYEDYLFILENSSFTKDYYALVEYVSSSIINAYTSVYSEKTKAGLDALDNYLDSNYTSNSSVSLNELVMWDNVIKEKNSYKLEDGSIIKVPITNDLVAQKDNELYIGTKIPAGFKKLEKLN